MCNGLAFFHSSVFPFDLLDTQLSRNKPLNTSSSRTLPSPIIDKISLSVSPSPSLSSVIGQPPTGNEPSPITAAKPLNALLILTSKVGSKRAKLQVRGLVTLGPCPLHSALHSSRTSLTNSRSKKQIAYCHYDFEALQTPPWNHRAPRGHQLCHLEEAVCACP